MSRQVRDKKFTVLTIQTLFQRFVLNDNFHDTEAIRSLVAGYIQNAKVNRHFGRELSYVLPREQVSSFPPLFARLEELVTCGEAQRMGFNSYGVSMTTLEEVKFEITL